MGYMLSSAQRNTIEQQVVAVSRPYSMRQFTLFNLVVWVVIEGLIRVGQSFTFGKPAQYLLIDFSDTLTGFLLCFAIRPVLSRYVDKITIRTVLVAFLCSIITAIVWQLIHTEVYIAVFPLQTRAETLLLSLKGLRFPFYLFLVWCAIFAFWQNNIRVKDEYQRRLLAEKEGKKAILHNLQSKLAPHFIFNTLNSAYALAIEEGAEKTQRQLHTMADLIRRSTNVGERLFWNWQDERQFLADYIALEESRFGDRFNVIADVEEIDDDFQIPVLLLQPLVENVIVHNVTVSLDKVDVRLVAKSSEAGVKFRISNNLVSCDGISPPLTSSQSSMGTSLQNLAARLDALYQGRASCDIKHTDSCFDVAIVIPRTESRS